MNSLPNLLVVTPWFPASPGAREGSFILDQVQALRAVCGEVTVLVCHPAVPESLSDRLGRRTPSVDAAAYRDFGLRVHTVSYFSLPGYRLGVWAGPAMSQTVIPAIARLTERLRIDVLHSHTEELAYTSAIAADKFHLPAVLTMHGVNTALEGASPRRRAQLRTSLQRLDRVLLVGPPLRAAVEQLAPSATLEVVLNGFQVPDHLPASVCPRQRSVRIVSVANLDRNKGVDITIKALAALAIRGYKEAELIVVGDGPERPALEHLAVALGLDSGVQFLGHVPHAEALAEIAAADIFCVPSWREACGIAHMEAMGLGKLAIGCRTQGPNAFIEQGRTGFLVEPRDVYDLAEVLQRAIIATEEREQIARAGHSYALAHLTWRANAERIVEIYQKVCRSPVGQPIPAPLS